MHSTHSYSLATLLFAAASLVACGDNEDPAARPDAGQDTSIPDSGGDAGPQEDTDEPGDAGTDTVPTDTDVPDDGGGMPDTVPDTDVAADTDTTPTPDVAPDVDAGPGDDTEVTDGGTGEFVCGEGVRFSGQVFGTEAPRGGVPVFVDSVEDIEYGDAGLSAVRAAAPARGETESDLALEVVSATVTATSYATDGEVSRSSTIFWVEDVSGSVLVRLSPFTADVAPPFDVRVGQQISFTVTELLDFNGTLQVQKAENWSLVESDTEVYILERTGRTIAESEAGRMVRVTGTADTAPEACGGESVCRDIEHGAESPAVLRIRDNYQVELGQCVSMVGPVDFFSGTPQINAENFDWVFRYRTGE